MPASLERLIAEVEPAVVTDELLRDCIVVGIDNLMMISFDDVCIQNDIISCWQVDCRRWIPCSSKRNCNISFSQVECVQCSFKKLARITNLWGLDNLVKLQLDNNVITKIENLSHLVCMYVLRCWPTMTNKGTT